MLGEREWGGKLNTDFSKEGGAPSVGEKARSNFPGD